MFTPQGFCRKASMEAPPSSMEFARRIAFVGSWKQERGRLIDELEQSGVHVDVFGSGWPDGKWIDDPVSVFRSTQINLGSGYIMPSAGITSLKGRDTECPASGACYLTTFHWELPELFEIGKEILCYRNIEELREILAYYLPRPDACQRIAVNAHQRAWKEHAWEFRMRRVFENLGLRTAN